MNKSKLPIFTPLNCDEMERSIQLCNGVEYLIDEFLRDSNGKEPSQLFEESYHKQILKIVSHLDELIQRLTYLADKNNKEFYFDHLYAILKALTICPNPLIITAHYLNPANDFKRFINRNTLEFELGQISKKIKLIKPTLYSLSVGKKSGVKNIFRNM